MNFLSSSWELMPPADRISERKGYFRLGFIKQKKIIPRAQMSTRRRSEIEMPVLGKSLRRISGAIYTAVPPSTLVVFVEIKDCVWISSDRLSPKSVNLHAIGLKRYCHVISSSSANSQ